MTPSQLLRSGYRKDATGFYRKRVCFDVPSRPELQSVKYLTRNSAGQLVKGDREIWVRKALTT